MTGRTTSRRAVSDSARTSLRHALAQRLRDLPAWHPNVREVRMIGGLSFMVGDRMAVAAGRDGDLHVRTDPAVYDDILRRGREPAYMARVDHLRRSGRLSEEEIVLYVSVDEWFQENLPNPPFYDDGNSAGAVTWFKNAAEDMTDRLRPLLWERSVSDDPGRVVYEDRWQVGVIPSARLGMTPLPYPGKLGPSDWFEVRKGNLSNPRL